MNVADLTLGDIAKALTYLLNPRGLMATAEELTAKIDQVTTALTDLEQRATADFDHIKQLLEGRVDPALYDQVAVKLDELAASIPAFDLDPTYPEPEPTP